MDTFQRLVEGDLANLAKKSSTKCIFDNLTVEEKKAIRALKDDNSEVIRNADKGGLVMVMDTETYRNEAI